jgi:WD40 repeat protein
MLGAKLAVSKVSRTIKSMGEGLGVISKGFAVSTRSVDVGHKLLWHILKCHRYDLGTYSHNALLELLFYDPSNMTVTGNMVDQVITLNQAYQNGYRLNFDFIHKNESPFHSPKLKVRSRHATNCIFQLLRFLPCLHQERLLFDLLTLVRVNKATVDDIIQARYWQHSLFHVASDTVEALINFNNVRSELLDSPNHSSDDSVSYDHKGNNVYARFDLSFQLYATLLGHCLRADDESAHALDLACSLQRVCVNGVSVFGILLSHVLNDLISNGTLISTLKTQSENSSCTESDILQDCATSFFKMDVTQAAKHWKKLRNLTALVTAVVTDNGHGLVDLFDYRNSLASIIDNNSGGIFGIRLSDRIQNGIMAIDVFAETTTARERCDSEEVCQRMSTHYYRMICTTLSCQILDLLDPFIFFHSTGVLSSSPQQQGFALVQSIEPRFGLSQGPLIFSLVRLSLVALSHLEPSSSKFLRSCNMLRCFLRWCLDMVQNSSPTATKAFDEDTALNDRVIVCIILQCHRSLSKCFSVLNEIELLEGNHIQVSERPRHLRRLYSAVSVLGGIICDVYEARKNLLLEVLTKEAYSALESSVLMSDEWKNYAETPQPTRNRILRDFLESDWVKCFHDNDYFQANVDGIVSIVIPEILNRNGENKIDRAVYIMKELAVECKHIRDDYHHAIDSPFSKYLEDQKSWADTAAVRDLEYDGNCAINSLTTQYQCRVKTMARSLQIKCDISSRRYLSVQRKIQTNSKYIHWKLARSTDRLHRRILLIPNMNFDNHADASYDRASGLEMDAVVSDTNPRREDQLQIVLKAAKEGIVRYHEAEKSDGYALNPDGDLCHDSEPENSSADFVFEENNPEWDHHVDDKLIVDKDINIGSSLWAKQYIWEPNERLLQYLKGVQVVTVQTVLNGELVLTTHSLYFRPIEEPKSVMTKESLRCPDRLEEGRWRLNRLTDVHERRYILRPQAIELFFVNAPELFINFSEGPKIRDKFVDNLRRCRTPLVTIPKALNPKAVFKRNFPLLTQRWQERKISNFEYLMKLNIIAGRTFNDISQYPVFPWIIADYESPELDLTNDKTFRDLTKPIGAINPQRLLQLLQRYHDLDGLPDEERFLYGSHYSSPGVVLHFLLRQEPFTSMAVELQSGRFDCPDRLFFDMAGCWHSCMHSTSDVKELIPEMFTCPEIFLNTNNFQFGKTQKDFPVDNVKLPPWANDSPYEFVRLNKLALESEYVSNHLHHWIDLIFGYKQRGPESIKANNVFHFLSYEGSVDLDKITDELNRKATEAHIQNFGQTPSQLLATPHPARYAPVNCWKPVVSEYELNRLMSYTPFKQFGGSRNKSGHGPALSIEVFLDLVIVIYADLCVGSYKWAPTKHGKTPFLLKMDKIRSLSSRDMSVSKFAMEAHTGSINPSLPCSYESIGNWSFAVVKDKESFSPVSKDMTMTTQKIDATLLSCGYCDNSLKAHSIDGLRLKCSKTGGHIGAITCLELGEECSLLITGGEDATCRVWTVEQPEIGNALIDSYVKTAQDQKINDTLMCCLVLWGQNSAISCLAFDSDLDILISGSVDGYICIHTVRCGEFIRSLHTNDYQYPDTLPTKSKVETTGVRKLSLHKDGIFIAHLETGMLQMRSVNGAQLGCADAGEKLNVMKMIPGGYSFVTGGESGKVHVRSLQNLTIKYALNISDYGPVHSIAFNQPSSSIEQFIFVGSQDGSITVVCAQREKEVQDNDDASKAKFNQNQMIELGGDTSVS